MVYLIATTTTLKVLFVQLGLFFRLKSYWFFPYINLLKIFLGPVSCPCLAFDKKQQEKKSCMGCFLIKYVWTLAEVYQKLWWFAPLFGWKTINRTNLFDASEIFQVCFSILRYLSGLDRFFEPHVPNSTQSVCFDKPRACPGESR